MEKTVYDRAVTAANEATQSLFNFFIDQGLQPDEAGRALATATSRYTGQGPTTRPAPARTLSKSFGSHRSISETITRRKLGYAVRACIDAGLQGLTFKQASVLLTLARKFHRAGEAREWIGTYGQLAADAGVSRPTAIRAVRIFIDHGWINRKTRTTRNPEMNLPSIFSPSASLNHLMISFAVSGSNASHPDNYTYTRKKNRDRKIEGGRDSKGDRTHRTTLPRRPVRSRANGTKSNDDSTSSFSEKPSAPLFAREVANVPPGQTTPSEVDSRPEIECAKQGLALLGAIVPEDAITITDLIEIATDLREEILTTLTLADWQRASTNLPMKSLMAFIATGHKTRTHTEDPIRRPNRYFQSLLRATADPTVSVRKILTKVESLAA